MVRSYLADVLEHLTLSSANYVHHVLIVAPFLALLQNLLKEALAFLVLCELEVVAPLVAGQGQMFEDIRKVAPNHFLLVPGVGAQGGSLQEVCKYGIIKDCGLLVNSSRGIIYASNGEDFAEVAGQKAKELQEEMAAELAKLG